MRAMRTCAKKKECVNAPVGPFTTFTHCAYGYNIRNELISAAKLVGGDASGAPQSRTLNTMGSCLKMVMRSLLWLMFAVGSVVTAGLLVIVLNTSHSIEWVDVDTHVFRVVADKYVDFEGKERGFFLEFVNGKQLNKCELIFYTSNNDITCMVESFRLTKHDVANNKMTELYRLADALIDDCRDRTRIVVLIDREFSPVTIGESLAIEIAFKPSVHGERINPLQFSFISQKVSFVDMPGW